jgi:hypothetical protein
MVKTLKLPKIIIPEQCQISSKIENCMYVCTYVCMYVCTVYVLCYGPANFMLIQDLSVEIFKVKYLTFFFRRKSGTACLSLLSTFRNTYLEDWVGLN